ncbi:hypothetical protein [Pseudovibrio sp. Tun.PSC04-5.I4]|uniref:hypothetical protein n=1 Tax=Pseudovibrio sp. Tun.PSC04-5.I4 TaxID=1798213 RepID=UPI00088BDDD5|nr:hypothetical protein [Pseudovibrio sp. Tun.PSC04-5.I4]SDQ24766.1 hypothetical protein SAMN04515695_0654 [Pseudovibrio sp. Tun.PSC04-5.I4]
MKATRYVVQDLIKAETPTDRYAQNYKFIEQLMVEIKEHRLFSHPVISDLQNGVLSKAAVTDLHMDFRLLTKQFTDVILMAQFLTREIDSKRNMDHMSARFLITLNLLDELGFYAGQGDYEGTPKHSHYLLFEQVIDQLGVPREGRDAYKCGAPAVELHRYVEEIMNDFLGVLMYIAVTEEEAMVYSPPMREAARAVGVSVDAGYYNAHGSSSDDETDAEDDEHQNDILVILSQFMMPEDHARAHELAFAFCDRWCAFWENQYAVQEAA